MTEPANIAHGAAASEREWTGRDDDPQAASRFRLMGLHAMPGARFPHCARCRDAGGAAARAAPAAG